MKLENLFNSGTFVSAILFAFVILVIRLHIKNIFEKQAYKVMMRNPSDVTVSSYIKAFNGTYSFFSTIYNTKLAITHRNNQLRQATGWEIINESTSVSAEVKTNLKNAFIEHGVPIKNRVVK